MSQSGEEQVEVDHSETTINETTINGVREFENLSAENVRKIIENMPNDRRMELKSNAKISKITLDKVKEVGKLLHLSVSGKKKSDLLDEIFAKIDNSRTLLPTIQANGQMATSLGTYRKDKNTFPRLFNFLLRFPTGLQGANLLAPRLDQQNKTVETVFVDCAGLFNNVNENSGGNSFDHEGLREIDPESLNCQTPNMTAPCAFDMFITVRKYYAAAMVRYEASSHHHNSHDFSLYTNDNPDLLYMYMALRQQNNAGLLQFCKECYELNRGVDTAATSSTSTSSTTSSAPIALPTNSDSFLVESVHAKRKLEQQQENLCRSIDSVVTALKDSVTPVVSNASEAGEREKTISIMLSTIDRLEDKVEQLTAAEGDHGEFHSSRLQYALQKLQAAKERLDKFESIA